MKKFSLLLSLFLFLTPLAKAAGVPFAAQRSYDGRFADLDKAAWYYESAVKAYEYGLLEGCGEGRFAPGAPITAAELLTLSARVHARYPGGRIAPSGAKDWCAPYLDYLQSNGLIATAHSFPLHEPADRAMAVGILSLALPEEWYDARNAAVVTDGYALGKFITDVTDYTPNQREILLFYKYGILSGVDERGSFAPEASVSRAEIAAMLIRMVEPDTRLCLDWSPLPYESAAGRTLASVVSERGADTPLRQMLRRGESSLTLNYGAALSRSEVTALTRSYAAEVKSYCEQMYNSVSCTSYSDGTVKLRFSSTAASDETLQLYRAEAMDAAIAVHDYLWESGYLAKDMSERELAYSYFTYLAQNCAYDAAAADTSVSHLAYGALVNNRAVCDGYTGAYNLFLKLEGIDCTAVFSDEHIWTRAVLDGETVYIDVTNGDLGTRIDASFFAMSEQLARSRYEW